MPIQVEQFIDEPIVKFIFTGTFDPKTVQAAHDQAAHILDQTGAFYAILDIQETEITFGEALSLLNNVSKRGMVFDPRVTPVFVGKPIPGDPTDRFRIPIFDDTEQAVTYIRKSLIRRASEDAL